MNIIKTDFKGLFIIEPAVFEDERGYFMETFNEVEFAAKTGANPIFVQDNESCSNTFVIRGLHYQTGVHAQSKLVRVSQGSVVDSVVDIRPNSETYGKSFSILLTDKNKRQLYVPRGFAHGFSVLMDNTIFNYKCDNYYNKDAESGINPLDPALAIHWIVKPEEAIISQKDKILPNLCDINK